MAQHFKLLLLFFLCVAFTPGIAVAKPHQPWRAIHLLDYNTDADLDALGQKLETLAQQGINVVILEVDYNFAFKSHPELRRGTNPITFDGARRLAKLCRKHKLRLIPQ